MQLETVVEKKTSLFYSSNYFGQTEILAIFLSKLLIFSASLFIEDFLIQNIKQKNF